MADSAITKRALAASLKSLMSEQPFSKISIGEICDRCEMNRKSFYYHFRDKYDLVNWIFEREFVSVSKTKSYFGGIEAFGDLCDYLYQNREFYRQALKIEGQNSFSECFTQFCSLSFTKKLESGCDDPEIAEFQAKLLAFSLKNAIDLWLSEKECMNGKEFSERFVSFVKNTAAIICNGTQK